MLAQLHTFVLMIQNKLHNLRAHPDMQRNCWDPHVPIQTPMTNLQTVLDVKAQKLDHWFHSKYLFFFKSWLIKSFLFHFFSVVCSVRLTIFMGTITIYHLTLRLLTSAWLPVGCRLFALDWRHLQLNTDNHSAPNCTLPWLYCSALLFRPVHLLCAALVSKLTSSSLA